MWNDYFESFVDGVYRYDYNLTRSQAAGHPNDETDVELSLGLRYYGDTWSGAVSYSKAFARDNFDEDTIFFMIRGDF